MPIIVNNPAGEAALSVAVNDAVAMMGFTFIESVLEENPWLETIVNTLKTGVDNFIPGLALGFVEYEVSQGIGVVLKGDSNVDFDIRRLSRSQQKAIESADNIINDHLKSSDLSAALGDLQGNPIPKPDGGYWDHAQEVKDAYAGLVRAEKTLSGSLQNPNLAPDARAFIQGKYDTITYYLRLIEEMFEPYGGIN